MALGERVTEPQCEGEQETCVKPPENKTDQMSVSGRDLSVPTCAALATTGVFWTHDLSNPPWWQLSCKEGSGLGLTDGHQIFSVPLPVSRVHPGVATRASRPLGASRAQWPLRQSSEREGELSTCMTGKPNHQRMTTGGDGPSNRASLCPPGGELVPTPSSSVALGVRAPVGVPEPITPHH